ncbi:hypothetical protein F5Y14DRAFT_392608 [Nemania sp. NC0429]|nr:hypothetical protein F5Y14DRAFT_392608 [Nemania sp. NC0429]
MRSIPTVDRELIDLSTEHVKIWNEELLQIAGIVGRVVWALEMNAIKDCDQKVWEWVRSSSGWTLEARDRQLSQAKRVFTQFDFQASTPLLQVGVITEEHFWNVCNHIDIISTQGVRQSSGVRLRTKSVMGFVDRHPLLPQYFADRHVNFVRNLKSRGLISEISAEDVELELSLKTLNGRQLGQLFDWASQENDESIESVVSVIKAATVKISEKRVISLSNVKHFADYEAPDETLPSDVIPYMYSQDHRLALFQQLGWQSLPIAEWARLSASTLKDYMNDPVRAEEILAIISSNLRKEDYEKVVEYMPVVPTDVGMIAPSQSYFRSATPFKGLPYVLEMPRVQKSLLEKLGVQRVVKMEIIVHHLDSATDNTELLGEYISYLIGIPRPLSEDDHRTLSTAPVWHAEDQGKGAGYIANRKYTLRELFEPSGIFRELKVPTLYLPRGYRQEGPEGELFRSLGLQSYLSVSEIINLLDRDTRLEMLEVCVSFLTKLPQPLSEEDKKNISSACVWHAEDRDPGKDCKIARKYVLDELFEPSYHFRELQLPTLYLPQGYRQGGREGKFFPLLGLRTRLSISELIRMIDTNSNIRILRACISYLIENTEPLSEAEAEILRTTCIWKREVIGDCKSDGKYRLNELFEPSDEHRELQVPILYLPRGYQQEGLEGRFFRPLGLKTYLTMPELIKIITTAISNRDFVLRDHGLRYFVKHHRKNKYRNYSFADETEKFLPTEDSPGEHAAPKECFTSEGAALLGFPILRKDLHGNAAKFQVAQDPPLSHCVDRLIRKPLKTKQHAEEVFAYLSSFCNEGLAAHRERLANSAIVPIFPKLVAENTANDADGEDTPVIHRTPPTCFIGSLDKDVKELANLFCCEEFDGKAAQFLKFCGANDTPSANDIAKKFLEDPGRALEVVRSEEAYQQWFIWLGNKYRESGISDEIKRDMRTKRFLLTTRYHAQATTGRETYWALPQEAVVVDDSRLFEIYHKYFPSVPLNIVGRANEVETFCLRLGCKILSSLVRESHEISPLIGANNVDSWRGTILLRSKIFLDDVRSYRRQVSWDELKDNLRVRLAESITMWFELDGVRHSERTTVVAVKEGKTYDVCIVADDDDISYALALALAKLLVRTPTPTDTLLLESMFQKSLATLQRRGYDIDRILGPDRDMIGGPIPQHRSEEPTQFSNATVNNGKSDERRSETHRATSSSSYQGNKKPTIEHKKNNTHSVGLGRDHEHEGNSSLYTPHIVPRGERDDSHESHDFVNMSAGYILAPSYPMTIFAEEDTQDTRYFGELYMSAYLGSFLGPDVYIPNKHWTSRLRSRNGHSQYHAKEQDCSTFTICENNGRLGELVTRTGAGILLGGSCKFHIEVCATRGDLHSLFTLSSSQYERAQKTTVRVGEMTKEIYILARVYKIDANPGLALYVDPWRLHRQGLISLQSASSYQGSILKAAPAILSLDSSNLSFDTDWDGIYKDLDVDIRKIRLLKLTPDEENAPLRGDLICTSENPPHPFWAISYVWGPEPTPLAPFYFETSQGRIPITESLATCFQCLRRKGVTVYLWVDAVCINQRYNVEKSMQVRRMGSLYARAERVIIWMGNETDEDHRAIEYLNNLQDRPGNQLAEDASGQESVCRDIDKFLQKPWFTRVWIIQELVFGAEVQIICGNSEIGWSEFINGIAKCESQLNQKRPGAKDQLLPNLWRATALDDTRVHVRSSKKKYKLLRLLEMFFHTQSSMPRDKLFALLNMAYDVVDRGQGALKPAFNPDYDSTEEEILTKYATQFVKDGMVLDLLYRAGSDKACGFCTWIPDLMNQRGDANYPSTISTWNAAGSDRGREFGAGALLPPEADVRGGLVDLTGKGHRTPILYIKGIVFDDIQSCHPLRMGSGDTGIQFSLVLDDLRRYISHLQSYPNGGENWREELLVKLLVGDAFGPLTAAAPRPFSEQAAQEKWPEGFERELLALQPDQDARQHVDKPPGSWAVVARFWQTAAHFAGRIPRASVCVTRKGYVGLVPGAAAPGDAIFIPRGARVPFVLRRRRRATAAAGAIPYRALIGEAYVHGLMHYDESAVMSQAHLAGEEVCLI